MDSGPVALTIDRDYWLLIKFMRRTYERGSVLIMPYVSSTFLDVASPSPLRGAEKDAKSWYFFRGTLKRKNGGQSRPMLKELGALLQDADFEGVKLNKKDGSIFTILNETSVRMRSSSVCVCPEGDSPTSLRVFEAIAAGCVPLIMVGPSSTASHPLLTHSMRCVLVLRFGDGFPRGSFMGHVLPTPCSPLTVQNADQKRRKMCVAGGPGSDICESPIPFDNRLG